MMTALQIVQEFTRRQALPVPAFILSNTDAQVVQLVSLMNEELDDLAARYLWPELQLEATFTATGVENQGELAILAPGYKNMVKDTLWSTTRKLRATGSITAAETQAIKSLGNATANTVYRTVRGQLHFIPGTNIAATDQYRFEYNSRYAVSDATAPSTIKQYFVKDGDTPLLQDTLILLGLRWRWKAAKGLPYSQNFDLYEERVKQAFIDSRGARDLSMGNAPSVTPGIVVPQGSWNV